MSSLRSSSLRVPFIAWSTSQEYVELVGETKGWVAVPPGTRMSTYENPKYIEAAPFAETVLQSIQAADPADATADPVPYTGIQYVSIPEFAGLGTQVGNGCTSGHGVCGIARLSRRSIAATLTFVAAAAATVFFTRQVLGPIG